MDEQASSDQWLENALALGAVEDELDDILECLIEGEMSQAEIAARGHAPETVQRVWRMVDRAEYKRRQAPPGVKISPRSFGRDRRYPITNGFPG